MSGDQNVWRFVALGLFVVVVGFVGWVWVVSPMHERLRALELTQGQIVTILNERVKRDAAPADGR